MKAVEESFGFNVGGCFFSISLSKLALFQDSLLLQSVMTHADIPRLFMDRDGCTFQHVHYYISSGKLDASCASEKNILYELASSLHLTSLQQALENLQSDRDCLQTSPEDLQTNERTISNYCKICACTHKSEAVLSPDCCMHEAKPLGLATSPLVASEKEVLYCFVPLEQVLLHPSLIACGSLLWLCEDVAVIQCSSIHFRFIANFLQSGKVLLPELFNDYEALCDEAKTMDMMEFIEALSKLSDGKDMSSLKNSFSEGEVGRLIEPVYVLTLSLLVMYPDSSLGQLYVDSNLDGSKLYLTGTGVLFQHVENWLGTSRLPLTRTEEELPCLCAYLDKQDGAYLAMKEAVREFFQRKESHNRSLYGRSWCASVTIFSLYKIIKVYAGTHWYATYFKTLIKHPELLSNSDKSKWIVFGESLLVKSDGQMFRHILNFLRCDRLLMPSDFREWPLLCHEIEAFQIPALSSALRDCPDYRAWCRNQPRDTYFSSQFKAEDCSLNNEESVDEGEPLSFQRVSPDNSSDKETSSTHSEKIVCISGDPVYLGQWAEQRASTGRKVFSTSSCTLPVRGCVLKVHHPPVLGKGEPGGYFTHSVIYTAKQPHTVQPAISESKDVAFAYFNMSYEEMVYARKCHSFLTGTILNSIRLDSKESAQRIVKLVYSLWRGHTEQEDFVQELLAVISGKPHKQLEKQENLLQWLKFTLPWAKRYAECVGELLRKTSLQTDTLFPAQQLEVRTTQLRCVH